MPNDKPELTIAAARAVLATLGYGLRKTAAGDYRVAPYGAKRGEGYFTNDLQDAFDTGKQMASEPGRLTKPKPPAISTIELPPTWESVVPVFVEAYRKVQNKHGALDELQRCGRLADRYMALVRALDDLEADPNVEITAAHYRQVLNLHR